MVIEMDEDFISKDFELVGEESVPIEVTEDDSLIEVRFEESL